MNSNSTSTNINTVVFDITESDDFDIEAFADLMDTAMSSTNPTVQKAFKNLMMIAAMVQDAEKNRTPGPLRKILNDINDLRSEVRRMPSYSYYYPTIVDNTIPNNIYPTLDNNTLYSTDNNNYIYPVTVSNEYMKGAGLNGATGYSDNNNEKNSWGGIDTVSKL